MNSELHPRIAQLATFYREGPKICEFMSPDITRFVLVPACYTDTHVGSAITEWAETRQPLALSYVWERDPATLIEERRAAITLFGNLLRILKEHETGQQISRITLADELEFAFSEASPVNPFLSYKNNPFFAIAMSPKHTSRYAPCFSVVLTRASDVAVVDPKVKERIRSRSITAYGAEYDADALFLPPLSKRTHT